MSIVAGIITPGWSGWLSRRGRDSRGQVTTVDGARGGVCDTAGFRDRRHSRRASSRMRRDTMYTRSFYNECTPVNL